MRRIWLGAAAILCLAGTFSAYRLGKSQGEASSAGHFRSRTKAIVSLAQQRPWKIVVIGDSIVELADVSDLCGRPTLNAGLAAARTEDVVKLADQLMPLIKPDLILIGVGTNDSWPSGPTPDSSFDASYRRLIAKAEGTGAKVALLTPPPVSTPDKSPPIPFDNRLLEHRGNQIKALGLPVVDEFHALANPQTGRLDRGMSDDGTHPSARGYVAWRKALDVVCEVLPPA